MGDDGNRLVFLARLVSRISEERITEALTHVLDEAEKHGVWNAEACLQSEDANNYTLTLYGEDPEGAVCKRRSVGLRHDDRLDRVGSVKGYAEKLAATLAVDLGLVVRH